MTKREQVTRILMMALSLAAGAVVCGAQQPATATVPTSPSPEATATEPAPDAAVTPPPEAPVAPPKVVCAGNELTISANNSTLSSVLAEVHRCMGTRIDVPDAAGAKRIFDKIGPGPASQVLDLLLSNTGYNYIIGASAANEEKIDSIVLLARTGDAATPAVVEDSRAGSLSRRAFSQMHQASIPHPMTDADAAAAAELNAAGEATPTPAPTPAPAPAEAAAPAPTADGQPAADPSSKPAEVAPAQPATPAATPSTNNSFSSHPSTTEEQIVNMQQMFELRKQLNQPPPSQPPQ